MVKLLLRCDTNYGNWRRGWVCKLLVGRGSYIGAGYIGGCTLFLAWKSGSRHWLKVHRNGEMVCNGAPWRSGYFRLWRLEFGLTTNANLVPYCSH